MLLDGIEHQQRARRVRAERIGELLARQGFSDALAQAKELAAGGSLGRPHFARYLVESGAVANLNKHSNAIWRLANLPMYAPNGLRLFRFAVGSALRVVLPF